MSAGEWAMYRPQSSRASSSRSKRPETASSNLSTLGTSTRTTAPSASWSNQSAPADAGNYREAISQQQQQESVKRAEMENKAKAMLRTQEEEVSTLEQSHAEQFDLFVTNSDSLLHGVRERCRRAEEALVSKHAGESIVWDKQYALENMKTRPSKDLLDLRRKVEQSLKADDWPGAEKLRAVAAQLEAHEMQGQVGEWMVKRDLEETKMLQRQARELKALRLKHSSVTTEAVLQQGRELEKMQKRLGLANLALSRQHAKERHMLGQSFKGNYIVQRASFGLPHKAASAAGVFVTPSSGSIFCSSGLSTYGRSDFQQFSQDQRAHSLNGEGNIRHQLLGQSMRSSAPPPPASSSTSNPAPDGSQYIYGKSTDGSGAYQPRVSAQGDGVSRQAWTDASQGANGWPDAPSIPPPLGSSSAHQVEENFQARRQSGDSRRGQSAGVRGLRASSSRSTYSNGGYNGPRAMGLDRALLPREVYERMQQAKSVEAQEKKASTRGGHTSLTLRNLALHEHCNNGKLPGKLGGEQSEAPSALLSNHAYAGSSIRPHTAAPSLWTH